MLTDVESDEFVFIGHMLFNSRAKSDFPCPEFNGELSFWVVFTLFKKCRKSLILQLQKKGFQKTFFYEGNSNVPRSIWYYPCVKDMKNDFDHHYYDHPPAADIFFSFLEFLPPAKSQPHPLLSTGIMTFASWYIFRCFQCSCEFFDIKRDPWLGMVMSPFNSVWQVDNSCPSQHFSHFCYWGGGDLKSQTELQSYICQKTNFQWAAVGAENTLHYIQDMDSKNIEE